MNSRRPFPIVADVTQMVAGLGAAAGTRQPAELIIPGHDPLVMERYRAPDPSLAGIVVRLDAEPLGGCRWNTSGIKLALITGAASGIGLGIARACLGAGMKVVIADVRPAALEAAAAQLAGAGGVVVPVVLDVTDRRQWADCAAARAARFRRRGPALQ